jgi:hypothetical protein
MTGRSKQQIVDSVYRKQTINGSGSTPATLLIVSKDDLVSSQSHPVSLLGRTSRDIGGTFQCIRREYRQANTFPGYCRRQAGSFLLYEFHGGQRAHASEGNFALWPSVEIPTNSYLIGLGSTAIARCIPTNPTANLATFLGELRSDGIPVISGLSLLRSRAKIFKNLGSEYLNVEFGWKPFLRDILSFARTVRDRETTIRQFERNSGKGVRRRYSFPVSPGTTSLTTTTGTPSPSMVGQLYASIAKSTGPKTISLTSSEEAWFSGSFTYYLKRGQGALLKDRGFLQKANQLLGIRITPEVLWELAPWSWAADWFTNAGDVFHNLSAFTNDGLVMRYGYLMCRRTATRAYTLQGIEYANDTKVIGPCSFSQEFTTIVKTRSKATPFGFGLDPNVDFTSRQWAITAALGLTRSDRQF